MRRIFLLLTLLLPFSGHAQLQGQALIDSLLKKLPDAKEDTSKIRLLNSIATTYKSINPDEGIRYGQLQLELARTLGRRPAIGSAYKVIGLNYHYKSDYTKALEYFNKALAIYADNPDSGPYGTIISHLGVLYQEMGDLDKALVYNKRALELDIKIKDSINIAGDYGNIGIIYLLQKEYEKALEYDFKSLDIFEQLRDKDGIAHNYGNIGNVYKEYENYTKALEYDTKALELFRELGDNGGIAINLGNIGGVYLAIAREMDSVRQPDQVLPRGSKNIFLAKAIDNIKQSIEISKKIGQLDNIIEFSGGLHEAYLLAGNPAAALEAFKQHVEYKDSVYSQDNRLKIANLETQRELMLKDKQIQIQKLEVAQKRNERIILFITIALLLVVIAVIVRKFLAQKRDNNRLAKEKNKHLDRINQQKMVMGDIAYVHSHEVSAHVATILGLVDVFNLKDYTDPDNKVVLDGIADSAAKLDEVVKDMIVKENLLNNEQKAQ